GYTLMDTNVEQPRLEEKLGSDFLGIPGTNGPRRWEGGWPRIRIDGFGDLGLPNDYMPYYRHDPQFQYVANGTWTRRKHNVRFGLDFYIQHLNHNQPEISGSGDNPAAGGFHFARGTTQLRGGPSSNDYNSFAAFLLGLARDAGKIYQYADNGYTTRARMFSLYARDQWQVTRRLTMTLGTRWEYFPFPRRADRGLERYDFANNKILVCGVGTVPANCGFDSGIGQFAPRAGLAWRATDTLVLRAGYGITTDPFNWSRPLRTNYPILANQVIDAPNTYLWATTLREGLRDIPPPELRNGVIDLPLTATVLTADPNNTVRGYIQSWNGTVEKELPGGWLASAGYVATRSINQMALLDQNWSPIGGGTAGRQMVVKFGRTAGTDMLGSIGTPKYDALQVRILRRHAAGQVRVGYTWGHSRGYTAEASGEGTRVDIPEFYRLNYGRTSQDVRHNLQLTTSLDLPFGKRRWWANTGAAAALLGGWQITGVFSAYTGRPFTVSGSGTSLDTPSAGQFADCLAPPVKLGRPEQWYDRSTFDSVPTTEVRFGTCGINSLESPGLINSDIGVFRRFHLSEKRTLQFRAEMFNLSNTPHFAAPNGSETSANFMVITDVRNIGREGRSERLYRLSLRLAW
ncbi:MAG TPA: TonB-dependent receptor, partial [Bryobacteraceae bacterium]|nr:TonB-dependent receptor [Bryobacteraceae bacterium]